MDDRRRNFAIGLFMTGALACLAALILLFGQYPAVIGGRTYEVHVYFDGALEQLEADTDVRMLGKRIGWVSSVEFRDGNPAAGIDAILRIDKSVPIPSDATAVLKEAAMGFGRPRLQIVIPAGSTAPPLPTDGSAVLPGKVVGPFEQLIPREVVTTLQVTARRIGELAAAFTPVAEDLHHLLKPVDARQVDAGKALANLSTALQRLDQAIKNINDIIGRPEAKTQLRQTIANLHQATRQATETLRSIKDFAESARSVTDTAQDVAGDLKSLVAEARHQLRTISQRIVDTTDRLDALLKNLSHAAQQLAEGKGTAGLLLTDERLYESLVLTADRLNAALIDLQALIKTWQIEGVRIETLKLR